MPDLKKLDTAHRLTPWSDPQHADFVAGHYGSLLQEGETAEKYVQSYEKKEKEFEAAYEEQRQQLREASKRAGENGQELPDLEKIDWDPRKRFAKAADKAAKEAEKAAAKELKEKEAEEKKAVKVKEVEEKAAKEAEKAEKKDDKKS